MNTICFLKLFGHPGYPAKNPGISRQKLGFPGFRRTYRTFWPPPLHVEDPHPTRRYPDQNLGLGSFFLLDFLRFLRRNFRKLRFKFCNFVEKLRSVEGRSQDSVGTLFTKQERTPNHLLPSQSSDDPLQFGALRSLIANR